MMLRAFCRLAVYGKDFQACQVVLPGVISNCYPASPKIPEVAKLYGSNLRNTMEHLLQLFLHLHSLVLNPFETAASQVPVPEGSQQKNLRRCRTCCNRSPKSRRASHACIPTWSKYFHMRVVRRS